jgi:hypothetical protein
MDAHSTGPKRNPTQPGKPSLETGTYFAVLLKHNITHGWPEGVTHLLLWDGRFADTLGSISGTSAKLLNKYYNSMKWSEIPDP